MYFLIHVSFFKNKIEIEVNWSAKLFKAHVPGFQFVVMSDDVHKQT